MALAWPSPRPYTEGSLFFVAQPIPAVLGHLRSQVASHLLILRKSISGVLALATNITGLNVITLVCVTCPL